MYLRAIFLSRIRNDHAAPGPFVVSLDHPGKDFRVLSLCEVHAGSHDIHDVAVLIVESADALPVHSLWPMGDHRGADATLVRLGLPIAERCIGNICPAAPRDAYVVSVPGSTSLFFGYTISSPDLVMSGRRYRDGPDGPL